jgi:hypothetical protein
MAKSTPPGALLQPQQLLESANEGVILGELIPWGAVEAISEPMMFRAGSAADCFRMQMSTKTGGRTGLRTK